VAEVAYGMKLFAAARKIILRQTKNRSAENDFSFGAENSGAFLRRMGCGGIFVSPTVFFSCGLRLCFLS